jgi:hypothetical protein
MPDREKNALLHGERGQSWPVMVHTAAEHAAWAPQPMRRPPPSHRQISRMNEVLDWLLVLAKQDRRFFKAVWLMCAERKGPGKAAKFLAVHRETVVIWRDNGLDRIAQHLAVSSMEAKKLRGTLMQGMHHPERMAG